MTQPAPTTITLPIQGLHCSSCAARVSLTLEDQPGVAAAAVDLKSNHVTISYDPAATTPAQLATALAPEGYTLITQ